MDYAKESLRLHKEWNGKISINVKCPVNTKEELALAYTPGVAQPCLEIQKDPNKSYSLTWKKNCVAVITDGSAVLGLGNIGPAAGMPVMEGKAALFKVFGDVDAIPLCIKSNNVDEIVNTIYLLSDSFGGINLEDISSPRCIEIEERLKKLCDIPVFHDDQHGTAIVVAAAIINATKLTNRKLENTTVVINGAGSAGMAIAKLLLLIGIGDIRLCDINGIIDSTDNRLNIYQKDLALKTNKNKVKGKLIDALNGADIFVGVSVKGCLKPEMIKVMNKRSIILAMANPIPEIMPDEALAAGAEVVGTGRSDFPNQINNVLVFPGIFRGALDVQAKQITDEMKITAAYAIASLVSDEQLSKDYIIPSPLDKSVTKVVAKAVSDCWLKNNK